MRASAVTVCIVSSPIRWTSAAVASWTPILTFTRRRMAVLDWFEEHVHPVAFTDDPDHAGIAVESEFQRLRFDRQYLRIATEDRTARVEALGSALEGLWQLVEPQNVVLRRYFGAWSFALPGADYDTTRRAFATRCIGADLGPRARGADAAALVDVQSDFGTLQLEFGLVTAPELAERLAEPRMGMMHVSAADRQPLQIDPDLLDAVSLFVAVRGTSRIPLGGPSALVGGYKDVEQLVNELVTGIGGTL